MSSEVETQGLPHNKLRPIIEAFKKKVKDNDVVKRMFKEHGIDTSEIDLIAMCFAKLPVSARTDHGVIYLNIDLIKDGDRIQEEDDHYIVHEFTHYCQQTTGTKPTPGSSDDDYLDNPAEQEAFQNQTEYLSETEGPEVAKNYIDKLLDHYDVKGKERTERIDDLLELAALVSSQIQKTAKDKTVNFQGIKVKIDRPKGFVKEGVDENGKPWKRVYKYDYGFIPGTLGGDNDGLDVFIGPNKDAPESYWAIQIKPKDGSFDEYKVFLGFDSKEDATKAYVEHIPKERLSQMMTMSIEMLKALVGINPEENVDE